MLSPTFACVALGLFFLPLVEVRCDAPNGKTLITQSGLQAAVGDASFPPGVKENIERNLKKLPTPRRPESNNPRFAPLMAVFPFMLVAAAVLGFAATTAATRLIVSVFFAAGAAVLLIAQMAIGFPLEQALQAGIAERRDDGLMMILGFHYTPWLAMIFVAIGGTIVTAVVENGVCSGSDNARVRPRRPIGNAGVWLVVVVLIGVAGIGVVAWEAPGFRARPFEPSRTSDTKQDANINTPPKEGQQMTVTGRIVGGGIEMEGAIKEMRGDKVTEPVVHVVQVAWCGQVVQCRFDGDAEVFKLVMADLVGGGAKEATITGKYAGLWADEIVLEHCRVIAANGGRKRP